MKIQNVLKSDRLCRAFTGLDINAFNRLLENFTWVYDQEMIKKHNQNCTRKYGGGRIGSFKTYSDKLLLVLFFLKVYPTEEVLGLFFDVCHSTAGIALRKYRPIVEVVLGKVGVLPKRKISSLDQLLKEIPELKELFIDGLERPVQRKRNKKQSNKDYSGKKKRNVKKNIVIAGKGKTGDKREILILSPTRNGRRHDKRIADKDQIYQHIPPSIESYQDTGLQGVQKHHPNSFIPKKKSKSNPLTEEDKFNNSLISSIRCTVEHSNWGLKRLNSISHIFRHKLARSVDDVMFLAAGLWNFHLLHLAK
jgi:DDE superfamily endonuclease